MYSIGQHLHVAVVWNQFCTLRVSGKLLKLACILVKKLGGEKLGGENEFLLVKQILLSFPHILSVGAVILH